MINAKERLIVALDVSTIGEARDLVDRLDGVVSVFKIGLQLQLAVDRAFIQGLIKSDKKVFLDYKYFDIEETVRRAVREVAAIGASFLTVHGNAPTIKAAVEGRGESSLKLLAVTVLTSLDSVDIRELGFPCDVDELVLYRARSALAAGCDGLIASGREVAAIRGEVGSKLMIVTPGIRPQASNTDDHKRPVTPTTAIAAGADYVVVGRPIRDASDPRAAAESIIAELQAAFEKRVT